MGFCACLPLNIPSLLSYSCCDSHIVEKTVTHSKLSVCMVSRRPTFCNKIKLSNSQGDKRRPKSELQNKIQYHLISKVWSCMRNDKASQIHGFQNI